MALEFLQDVIFGSDSFTITSGSSGKPEVFITTTGNNNKPSILTFTKDKGAAGADDDGIGVISFLSDNDAQQQTTFGNIIYSVESATDGQEEGRINIGVAALNGGGNNSANVIQGVGNGQNVTDVTIGLGATNVTTIAGTLTMGSTATLDNSGNLLTNAATATALTAGDKTISGDLTVTSGTSGDATLIISADTDNSEEGDSPRLWFKADGDITQGAIQHNDNTFDFISNVSANGGFRFLTGVTNNTGTTDPSNGATERMSIDSTGVTITGSIELDHPSDTTIARASAGKVTIEGAPIQTTQICTTHHNMSLDSSSSTADLYFPINSLADGTSSGLYYTRIVAAYAGKIVKILIKPSSAMGSSCKIYMSRRDHDNASTFHQTSGFQAEETFDGSGSVTTKIIPCGVGGTNAADWVFDEGDMLGFSIVKDTTSSTVDLAVTIVYEYTMS